jgi:hypothetical protein
VLLPRPNLRLESSCLYLLCSWNYKPAPLHPALDMVAFLYNKPKRGNEMSKSTYILKFDIPKMPSKNVLFYILMVPVNACFSISS